MGDLRVAVIVRYGLNPDAWRARHAAGDVVDATPYGYDLAEGAVALSWSADHPEATPVRWWRHLVRRMLGFDLVHVWRNRAIIREADAVWTHTEREHLGVAMLKAWGPRRYPARSLAQTVWLWDEWSTSSSLRRAFVRRLLDHHDVEVVLSRVNRDISIQAVPDRTVIRVPFGTHLAPPVEQRAPRAGTPRVLVVGNDRHRDWPLLAEVAALLPEAEFTVVTLAQAAREIGWPENVSLTSMSQTAIIEHGYARASAVAIPLRSNAHASGCTVAIEAVSAGLPVVASDAGGIDEYLAGSISTLVPVGDARAFADALRAHLADDAPTPDASVATRRGLSQHDYVARLVSITRSMVEGSPHDPAVEQFAPLATFPVSEGERG